MESGIPKDFLLHLLRHTFGAKVEILACQVGNQHQDYWVLLLQLRHPSLPVVVKLAGPEAPYPCPFDRTAMLHRLVAAHTTIPMPEILAVDISYQSYPWRYMIKTHIPGIEWVEAQQQMNSEELADAYQQIGAAVAQIHTIHFPRFGELAVDGSVQGDAPYLTVLREHARHAIQKPHLCELFFAVLEKYNHLFVDVGRPGLCHEDLHKYNLLFHHQQGQWRLATVLDFDKAWAGHPETDLARLDLWEGRLSQPFWEAYQAICPVDPSYPQRRPIYQFLWCLEFARNTPEHLADTQALCAELGLPPLERFD